MTIKHCKQIIDNIFAITISNSVRGMHGVTLEGVEWPHYSSSIRPRTFRIIFTQLIPPLSPSSSPLTLLTPLNHPTASSGTSHDTTLAEKLVWLCLT